MIETWGNGFEPKWLCLLEKRIGERYTNANFVYSLSGEFDETGHSRGTSNIRQ